MSLERRLPAEWEPQDGILLAWPHQETDWGADLDAAEAVFIDIVKAVTRFEHALIVAPEIDSVMETLTAHGVDLARVTGVPLPTDDTWARDFGPVTVEVQQQPLLLDFGFNGWGLKFAAGNDNQVTRRLAEVGALTPPLSVPGLVLEGGSIESDGRGTLLTTSACLLSRNRNPHLDRAQLEQQLRAHLGVERILWLEHGYLAGDDTDSHIDTLARLAPHDTILYVSCDAPGDEHYHELKAMYREISALRTADGGPFRLLALPWPRPTFDRGGERLPATYANFLVINGAVLVPTYADPADAPALEIIAKAFPGREVIGIDCRALVRQHGSLHCVTMQLPKGVLP